MKKQLEILKALSDKNRLRIVVALTRYDELVACQITELLQVTGATTSRHLSILTHAGILDSRKDGRWIYFKLIRSADLEPVFQWLERTFQDSEGLKADQVALEKITELGREELCRMQRGEECCPK